MWLRAFYVLIWYASASAGLRAHPGVGIVMDSKGNVFYTDLKQVWKIGRNGNVTTVAQTHTSWSPTGVLTAPNGDLWILECSPTNAVRVERITAAGDRIMY
jgi:streptogramin lyase